MKKIKPNIKKQALKEIKEYAQLILKDKFEEELKNARKGIVFMYDQKDIMGNMDIFYEDNKITVSAYEQFFNGFTAILEMEEDTQYTAKELSEMFYEYIRENNNVFLRLKEPEKAINLEDAIKICRKVAFWMPKAIIDNGVWYDTNHLGAQDENGNLIGARW